jgi:ABC-type transporter Mla maintaining outer membrane lipid asymmetry ATPase subunit MlaF
MLRVLDEDVSEPEGYLFYSAAMFAELELSDAVRIELRRYREAEAA